MTAESHFDGCTFFICLQTFANDMQASRLFAGMSVDGLCLLIDEVVVIEYYPRQLLHERS